MQNRGKFRFLKPTFCPVPILTHLLEVIERDLVAEKVKENVLKSASVTVGKNESVSVDPLGISRVAVHESGYSTSRVSRSVIDLTRSVERETVISQKRT